MVLSGEPKAQAAGFILLWKPWAESWMSSVSLMMQASCSPMVLRVLIRVAERAKLSCLCPPNGTDCCSSSASAQLARSVTSTTGQCSR